MITTPDAKRVRRDESIASSIGARVIFKPIIREPILGGVAILSVAT
jgi:hypothetical protein